MQIKKESFCNNYKPPFCGKVIVVVSSRTSLIVIDEKMVWDGLTSYRNKCFLQYCQLGLRSFRYKVVSMQVDSIQIDIVSRHHRSRSDTCRKSIRLNSIFRSVAGGEAGKGGSIPPEIFRFVLNSAINVEFCILKWTAVSGKLQFPGIVHLSNLCTVVLLCNLELCKGTNSYFCSAKNDQHL